MKCVCPMGGDRTCPDDCLLAVWANMPPSDRKTRRKSIAEQLFKQGFTQDQIATQLGVGQKTISRDLESLVIVTKPARPKGGRPKGSKRHSAPKRHYKETEIVALADEGLTNAQIAVEAGIGKRQVRHVVEREQIRREAKAEPQVDRADLSLTAQQKFDATTQSYKRKLEAEFHNRVNQRVREFLEETILPQHRKEQEQAQQIMRARKGIMDKTSFRLIWSALHPDSRKSISDRKLGEAFDVFSRLEKLLLDEKQSPTNFQKLPQTMAEWDRIRAAAAAARKTKAGAVRPR